MEKLKKSRVKLEKGELLIIYLPNERTKAVAACPNCSSEMPRIKLPGCIEIPELDGTKSVLYYAFKCQHCEGPYWTNEGEKIPEDMLRIKKKEQDDETAVQAGD
jgi:hypothetical protein